MKFTLLCGIVFLTLTSGSLFAQTAGVSDEELKKYAVVMDSINEMQGVLAGEIKTMVKSNAAVPVARYNELYKIIGDPTKLTETQATPEEIQFVKDVIAKRDAGATRIKDAYQQLARDYVGVAAFNKVKEALTSDTALQTKYQFMLNELAKDNTMH